MDIILRVASICCIMMVDSSGKALDLMMVPSLREK